MCRGLKIQAAVERMLHIWQERKVFEVDYVAKLLEVIGRCGRRDTGDITMVLEPAESKTPPPNHKPEPVEFKVLL